MNFSLGEHIKRARKNKKMTQTELAKLIGKTESSVRKYENGSVIPPLNVIYDICHVLKISDIELLGLDNFVKYSSEVWNEEDYIKDYAQWQVFKQFLNFIGYEVQEYEEIKKTPLSEFTKKNSQEHEHGILIKEKDGEFVFSYKRYIKLENRYNPNFTANFRDTEIENLNIAIKNFIDFKVWEKKQENDLNERK